MLTTRRWIVGLLAALTLAAAAPIAVYAQPGLVGDDEARIVLTGSMEPAISPGDIVFLDTDVTVDEVRVGDVVTFRGHADAGTTYTHRVVDVSENTGGTVLATKGDANEDPDPMRVDDAMLVGAVDHQIPVYGKAVDGAHSLPLAPLLIGLSIVTIVHELVRLRSRPAEGVGFDPVEGQTPEGATFEVVR
jgi:signal peptidase